MFNIPSNHLVRDDAATGLLLMAPNNVLHGKCRFVGNNAAVQLPPRVFTVPDGVYVIWVTIMCAGAAGGIQDTWIGMQGASGFGGAGDNQPASPYLYHQATTAVWTGGLSSYATAGAAGVAPPLLPSTATGGGWCWHVPIPVTPGQTIPLFAGYVTSGPSNFIEIEW